MFCLVLKNKCTHKRKKMFLWCDSKLFPVVTFLFLSLDGIILQVSPGRSQRSLPLPDLYKLHNLLHLNLFRGATDPEHRFFVIDTTGRHWEHDLMTQFLQQQLWCCWRIEMGICLGDSGIQQDPNGGDAFIESTARVQPKGCLVSHTFVPSVL